MLTNFTWSHGGNNVLITGSFNSWKVQLPMERNEDIFSITLVEVLVMLVITKRSASV